ncbi:MAG: dipeptidase [Porphyromonadaceae bacterium]|nr:dipeptidase [Porphyromonadaceae bacterium]
MSAIKQYIRDNGARFIQELTALIAIPSVSAQPQHKGDMQLCAEHLREHLEGLGATETKIFSTEGNPIVYAYYHYADDAPTILVYAHYDVMPPEPLELWRTPPFELTIEGEHMYARGADDDKGQGFIQIKGFETARSLGLVRCNVKFLIEGEEEIGSTNLGPFLENHKELLQAEAIIVSDTSMVNRETPSLTTGLRGLAYWEIEVTGPNRDLHSGHFGGAVANPINELCKLIARVQDEQGRITIPHFYDDVVDLLPQEREMIASTPFDEAKYKQAIGVKALWGEEGYSTLERNSCRPSFDVCGIWGGYQGEGSKTVLPSKAYAKVSCRLVAAQDHERISQAFIDYIQSIAPDHIQVEVRPSHGGEAYLCPITLPAYRAAEDAVGVAFGVKPLAVRRGGSIPIIATFERVLGVKTVLMGFGLESNAIHSPNENMPLDFFFRGIEAVAEFYKRYPLN